MATLLACIYEKATCITFILDQLETDNSKNIDFPWGGLWAAHEVADLLLTNKELQLFFCVVMNRIV